ncbi:2221f9fb-6a80-4175-8ff2-5ddcf3a18353 [Thermothielavioides terrestris]|uniref:2221f9fb-6a80-4175-8ff2-5ddcf3a18353 n=1 Tax=Thermothielavioides terrestris TaxID=2587410 RepID=A0A446B9S5_9PEZI|nr:2221f9fb-6a80-4175-8ff2-5ddcf3a18353 [Thermothielavioides terrestris]
MGLVQYDSSDEEEEVQTPIPTFKTPSPAFNIHPRGSTRTSTHRLTQAPIYPPQQPSAAPPAPASPPAAPSPQPAATQPAPTTPPRAPVLGPVLGPSRPPPLSSSDAAAAAAAAAVDLAFLSAPSPPDPTSVPDPAEPEQSRSPYTATRALLRDLTLPAVADLDIPGSPPGAPSAADDALTAKVEGFLRLKRRRRREGGGGGEGEREGEQQQHFNARLAGSVGMRNPALMGRLLQFVGVETEFDDAGGGGLGNKRRPTEQYATVLGADVWDPHGFPAWAYRGELRKAQERAARERERGKGEPVEFVPAAAAASGTGSGGSAAGSKAGSRAGTPGVAGVKRKGRFDT